jgi:hypothetical protein
MLGGVAALSFGLHWVTYFFGVLPSENKKKDERERKKEKKEEKREGKGEKKRREMINPIFR